MNALSFKDVRFGYHEVPVLAGISWEVFEGSMSGIVGPNGSGKTTLFRIATGLNRPEGGEVRLRNRAIASMSAAEVARSVALVPQMETIVFPYPVKQMVGFGRFAHAAGPGYIRKQDDEQIAWAMDLCGITELADRPVTELSGGELHRVLFARALAQDTPILLLDEPTAFMDIKYQVTLFDILLRLKDEFDKTIVCVTHDLNVALSYFDDVAVLSGGNVAIHGKPEDVLSEENLRELFRIDVSVHKVDEHGSRVVQLHSAYRERSR